MIKWELKNQAMASTSETGNAKNVDNLDVLITDIISFGAKYNPSNPFLLVTALKAKETSARASINAVTPHLFRFPKVNQFPLPLKKIR